MPVINVEKDREKLTMTMTAEFQAPAAEVWELWHDPRKLEKWWGPPGYPATFTDHELAAGGESKYFMTSPEGEKFHGWWKVIEVDSPGRLQFQDGFADENAQPNPDMPVSVTTVTFTEQDGVTRMALESQWPSAEAMDETLEMGAEEGMKQAMGQMDGLLGLS